MLLNYIKIQFLRFFKGRMWMLVLGVTIAFNLFAAFVTALVIPILESNYLGHEGFETTMNIKEFSTFLPLYLNVGYLLQEAPGIFTIIYIANYYKYRTHINLEIRLRNRILFAISEEIILIIMLLMMHAVILIALLIATFVAGFGTKDILDVLKDTETYYIIALIVCMGLANINTAYLLAKFFRSKIKPIIIQAVVGVFMAGVVAGISSASSMIESSESPAFTEERFAQILIIIVAIHTLVTFILGVFLFHRRYEEKVV